MTTKISDPSNASAIAGIMDWRSAVDALLTFWASKRRPFSSGEVAACLREHRPDLRFSVPGIGEYLRDLFYADTMPQFADDMGGLVVATQVARYTEGLYPDRTPAGIQVFVYAPEVAMGEVHDFEIFIPKPGETQNDAPVQATPQTTLAKQDTTGQTKTPVFIFGAQIAVNIILAVVLSDHRMTFNRTAFEAAVALSGKPMRGGDPVWVVQTDDTLTVHTSDPQDPNAKQYSLTTDRGRIHVPSADPANPFPSGKIYKIEVGPGTMVVML